MPQIQQLRSAKKELEKELTNVLQRFIEEHDVYIESINLGYSAVATYGNGGSKIFVNAEVDIKI